MRPQPWPETLGIIVEHYRRGAHHRELEEAWWRAEKRPFSEIINRVGWAKLEDDRRHPHQRRIKKDALAECIEALRDAEQKLREARNFLELFWVVEKAFDKIDGAGELAVYDAADRLGHYFNHTPTLIFMHAGTRKGARKIRGPYRREEAWAMHARELPDGLKELTCRGAEDVLCSYKDELMLPPDHPDVLKLKNDTEGWDCRRKAKLPRC